MEFGFSDEQLAFRDAVRELLADACPPAAVRSAWSGEGPGYDRGLWGTLGEMGALGLLAPVDDGGLGLTEVDLVLVLEESGRAALPGPLVEHAAVAVPLLATAKSGSLDATIAGKAVATFAERPSRVGWAPMPTSWWWSPTAGCASPIPPPPSRWPASTGRAGTWPWPRSPAR